MSSLFAWFFQGGELVQSVTSVVFVNNTTKTVDFTVPAGKRWLLQTIKGRNADDVTRSTNISKYVEAAKTNLIKQYYNANLTTLQTMVWPNNDDLGFERTNAYHQDIWIAANTLSIAFLAGGASTGATDADGIVLEYLEVDE